MRILFLRQGFKDGTVYGYRVTDGVNYSRTYWRLCEAYKAKIEFDTSPKSYTMYNANDGITTR